MTTTLTNAAAADVAADPDRERGSIARSVGWRFLVSYFSIYLFTTALPPIPGLGRPSQLYQHALRVAVPWMGAHVLHLAAPVSLAPSGSGDKLFDYVELLLILILSACVTLIWSLRAGRAAPRERVLYWFRVWVRNSLGFTMIGYGMAKVIKSQFPFPALDRWFEPIGNQSPMGVLWNFMGYSPGYNHFTGAIEAIGGLLLIWQRTTTLGALLVAAAMTNVVVLNFTYDVPVKLYSTHLLLAAIVLLAPDARRLARFFLLNRPIGVQPVRQPFARPWANRAALVAKSCFAIWIVVQLATQNVRGMRTFGDDAPTPPLYGIYEVQRFVLNGAEHPPLVIDQSRWRRVAIGRAGAFTIQYMNDSTLRFRVTKDDAAKRLFTLTPARATGSVPVALSSAEPVFLAYSGDEHNRVTLDGMFSGQHVTAELERIDETRYLLVSRGYHWINEVPFNR